MPQGLGAFLLPLDHVMFLSALRLNWGHTPFPVVAGERFIFLAHVH